MINRIANLQQQNEYMTGRPRIPRPKTQGNKQQQKKHTFDTHDAKGRTQDVYSNKSVATAQKSNNTYTQHQQCEKPTQEK